MKDKNTLLTDCMYYMNYVLCVCVCVRQRETDGVICVDCCLCLAKWDVSY